MLSIKEACRYANFLDRIFLDLTLEFSLDSYLIKTKETHHKNKACLDAEDEIIDSTPERQYDIDDFKLHGVANLLNDIINEKLKLSLAIDEAKKSVTLDWKEFGVNLTLDSALEYNKKLRILSQNFLNSLVTTKSSEEKKKGLDYTFNQEGNQVPYKYSIDVVKTIDYDRNKVKELNKKLLKKTDEISTQIDQVMLKEAVDFTAKYDIHDSIEEIIEKFFS
ncbi:hypothetical protein [Oceanirhabdus seepicola]|uniref:Uncharacterized protein n=1 Tax=Oceanirhabdus seepicola TaxID=2828781 RepID=A0A9J6NW36_9CLOT|nr:hypothetical protein [Oceanirhabdus seepicola]MCM1988268.1 hypothetical protein [Oceanirhabdus seepicola]